jgi:hypothetical protein
MGMGMGMGMGLKMPRRHFLMTVFLIPAPSRPSRQGL